MMGEWEASHSFLAFIGGIMTVADIIAEYNSERENRVTDNTKIRWLRGLEKKVVVDIIRKFDGHRDSEEHYEDDFWVDAEGTLHCPDWAYVDDDGNLVIDSKEHINLVNLSSFVFRNSDGTITYTDMDDDDFGMDSELTIPEPFSEVYLFYLDMKIAYGNNDSRRYNMAATEYNNAYLSYQQYYNRFHKVDAPRCYCLRHEVI